MNWTCEQTDHKARISLWRRDTGRGEHGPSWGLSYWGDRGDGPPPRATMFSRREAEKAFAKARKEKQE